MRKQSQKQLDRATAKRQARTAKENADIAIQAQQEAIAEAVLETRATTEAEVEAEIAAQEASDPEGYTPQQRQSLKDIATIEAAKATLRSYGLYYTINSDRTADRQPCECGCGQFPAGKKSRFCPGHDAKAHSALAGPKEAKHCQCGCGTEVKGSWAPGHNAQHAKRMKEAAKVEAA